MNHMFKPSKKGLFLSDVKCGNEHILVHTVDSIKNKCTIKEYSDARKAQTIQDIIRWPSTKDYIRYVENYMLPNCPNMKADITRAEEILGPPELIKNEKILIIMIALKQVIKAYKTKGFHI